MSAAAARVALGAVAPTVLLVKEAAKAIIGNSFAKLKVKQLDLLAVHSLNGWETSLPLLRELKASGRIRSALHAAGCKTPVIAAGGIHNFEQAETILNTKKADIVGLARQALADPDWFRKVRSGRGETIRLCEYSNYCEGLDQKHKAVTCQLWDRTQLDEEGIAKTADGKRRLIAPDFV